MTCDHIETMAFDPIDGLSGVEQALAVLKAAYPAFDRHDARNELQAATFRLRTAATVRIAVSPSGAIAVEVGPEVAAPAN